MPATRLRLSVHPTEQGPSGLGVSVSLAVAGSVEGPGWLLDFLVEGDIGALRLPAAAEPGPADGLWRHTCLEAFVQDGDGPAYREFNFSPSGQWAVYRFTAERHRSADDPPPPVGPSIDVTHSSDALRLQAWIPRALLPLAPGSLGLSAVIETQDGQISHWALHHPRADRPDFHHANGRSHRPAVPPFPPESATASPTA